MIKDNFNTIRLILALIVVVAHIRDLTEIQIIYNFTYFFDSDFAIKAFFSISGFLVFKSYDTTDNKYLFAKKRILRIYPGYVTAIIFCLLIGYFCSVNNLKEFITSYETFKYLAVNLIFLNFLQPDLPGSLYSNPSHALNGSLWTIKIEILFYFFTPFLISFYKRNGTIVYLISIIAVGATWIIYFKLFSNDSHADQMSRQLPAQLPYYALGGLLYLNKEIFKNVKYFAVASFIFLYYFDSVIIELILKPIFYSTITILLCTQLIKKIDITKGIDFSYGIYLFHFPIIQLLIYIDIFKVNIFFGIFLTLSFSLFMSFLTWHFVERPLKKLT